jgi:hypothetical protein
MLKKDNNPACNQSTLSHRNQNGYSIAVNARAVSRIVRQSSL